MTVRLFSARHNRTEIVISRQRISGSCAPWSVVGVILMHMLGRLRDTDRTWQWQGERLTSVIITSPMKCPQWLYKPRHLNLKGIRYRCPRPRTGGLDKGARRHSKLTGRVVQQQRPYSHSKVSQLFLCLKRRRTLRCPTPGRSSCAACRTGGVQSTTSLGSCLKTLERRRLCKEEHLDVFGCVV